MAAAFGLDPNAIINAPPEIQDELERIRDRIAQQRAAGATPGRPGASAPMPSLTDDEILRSIEAAEFGLPA